MDMLHGYRDVFSLKDEIGKCPNIKVEIDVTDKITIFIRPCHVREEDKAFIDKENEVVMLYGNIEGRIISIFQPYDVNK